MDERWMLERYYEVAWTELILLRTRTIGVLAYTVLNTHVP